MSGDLPVGKPWTRKAIARKRVGRATAVGTGDVGPQPQRRAEARQRLLEPPLLVPHQPQTVVPFGVLGVDVEGGLVVPDGFRLLLELGERAGDVGVKSGR